MTEQERAVIQAAKEFKAARDANAPGRVVYAWDALIEAVENLDALLATHPDAGRPDGKGDK